MKESKAQERCAYIHKIMKQIVFDFNLRTATNTLTSLKRPSLQWTWILQTSAAHVRDSLE